MAACVDAGAVSVSAVALHLRPGVREHYLAWLEGARPDLMALHRARFGRHAYQADAEGRRLAALVADVQRAADRRGGRTTGGGRPSTSAISPAGPTLMMRPAAKTRPACRSGCCRTAHQSNGVDATSGRPAFAGNTNRWARPARRSGSCHRTRYR